MITPRNDESAGKIKSTTTTKGNKYLRRIIVQCGRALSRTKGSKFQEVFIRLRARKSRKKSLIAVERKVTHSGLKCVTIQTALQSQQTSCL